MKEASAGVSGLFLEDRAGARGADGAGLAGAGDQVCQGQVGLVAPNWS